MGGTFLREEGGSQLEPTSCPASASPFRGHSGRVSTCREAPRPLFPGKKKKSRHLCFFAFFGILLKHTYVYMNGVASDADAAKKFQSCVRRPQPRKWTMRGNFFIEFWFSVAFWRTERSNAAFFTEPLPSPLVRKRKKETTSSAPPPPPSHKEDFHVLCVVALHACVSYRMSPGSSFDPHTSVSHMSTAKRGKRKIVLYFRQTAVCVDS